MAESQQGSTQSVETTAQFGKGEDGEAKRWLAEIRMYESELRDFSKRGDKIIKRYRNERFSDQAATNTNSARGFAMFWANVQTLQPTILANPPKANVTRRFKDEDPVARVAAQIAERCLDVIIEQPGYYQSLKESRDDYLLVGEGCQWWRYVPKFTDVRVPVQITSDNQYEAEDGRTFAPDEIETDDDQLSPTYIMDRELESEQAELDYLNWKDFLRSPGARTWSEVSWVGKRAYMTRDELIDRFGAEKGNAVTLDHEPPKGEWGDKEEKQFFKKATVYEIWDKVSRNAIWVPKNSTLEGLLDKRPDPLQLKDFFPCPRPLLGTTTSDRFQPVPDFLMYQDQAQEMDTLTQRIYKLIEAIKVKGLFAANIPEFQKLLADAGELDMTPVDQSILALIGGDMSKSVWFWPIDVMVAALNELIAARNVVKQDAYEITGLSDIIRGATDPNETLGAQQLKVQSGSIRVRDRQQEMARFIRDGLVIAFSIVFNHFSDQTIAGMCDLPNIKEAMQPLPQPPMMGHNGGPPMSPMPAQGMPPGAPPQPAPPAVPGGPSPMPPQGIPIPPGPTIGELALKLLRDKGHRQFRIDIETDSTIEIDQQAEKQARTEFVTAVGGFIEQAAPVLAQAPEFIPMFGEMLLFAVRGFKAGAQLETVIEQAMDALKAKAKAAAQSGPPPNPDMVVAQAKAQAIQSDAQTKQAVAQHGAQIDAQSAQASSRAVLQKSAGEAAARQQELQADARNADFEAQLNAMRAQNEAILAEFDKQAKTLELLIGQKQLEKASAQVKAAEKQAAAPVNNGADK